MAKITKKNEVFCEEYLIDLNATQAAIRAGYSPKTANEQAARLLANVSIQNRIAQLQAEQSRRTGVQSDVLHGSRLLVLQGDALAVKAALRRREDALRLGGVFLRVGDHG